jgi:hypothetical protein
MEKVTKAAGLTEEELLQMCEAEFRNAETFTTEIQEERRQGLNYYNSDPLGNEEEGLSRYVSSDVRDVVEWTLAQLVDLFNTGDAVVVFAPQNAEDMEAAQEETSYVQYVFERQNNGFLIMYEWFKTALIQKNGIVHCYWDERVRREKETYTDKTYEEAETILTDKEFEVEEITYRIGEKEYTKEEFDKIADEMFDAAAAAPEQANPMDAMQKLVQTQNTLSFFDAVRVDISGIRKTDVSQVKIEGVAPEHFFVNRDHNSVDVSTARYVGHRITTTAYDLIAEGYPEELVNQIPSFDELKLQEEDVNRFKKEGGKFFSTDSPLDTNRREVVINAHYIRADFDGDGEMELRRVISGGSNSSVVLENIEVDRVPYHVVTPYANPYKFYGRSVADNIQAVQRVTSQLWRNVLNNLMYSVIPRKIISGTVDMEDIMTYVPGGVIRKDANATIENDIVPFVSEAAFPMLDRVQQNRAERSGFSRESVGLNPSAIANSTNFVGSLILNQSQLLVKMIGSLFANTGVKTLMEHIRELCMKHEEREVIFDLTGKFVTADSRRWRKKRDAKARVGLGFSTKVEEMQMLYDTLALQEKLIAAQGGLDGPLTNAQKIYNLSARIMKRAGILDVNNYFVNPEEYEAPPPQQSLADKQAELQAQQLSIQNTQLEADKMLAMLKLQQDKKQADAKLMADLAKHEAEIKSREKMHEEELIYKYAEKADKVFQINAELMKVTKNDA